MAQGPEVWIERDGRWPRPDNRELLHVLITETAATTELRLPAFNDRGRTFVVGSLTYSENLHDFIMFLAAVRGVADNLAPEGHALAIIHNYLWGSAITATVRIMPYGYSLFLPESEWHPRLPADSRRASQRSAARRRFGVTIYAC